MKHKKIALIGMMGCGKTTVAHFLSKMSDIKSYEMDSIFEDEHGISIKDFFKTKGENIFREEETKLLKRLILKPEFILSTGGGIILREENRNILFNSNILTVYLYATKETIFNRIKHDTTRPLLLVEDPKKEIERILESRKQYYELADITIDTNNKTIEEICNKLLLIQKKP